MVVTVLSDLMLDTVMLVELVVLLGPAGFVAGLGGFAFSGVASTEPTTAAGLEQSRKARWRHGQRSADACAASRVRGRARALLVVLRRLLHEG